MAEILSMINKFKYKYIHIERILRGNCVIRFKNIKEVEEFLNIIKKEVKIDNCDDEIIKEVFNMYEDRTTVKLITKQVRVDNLCDNTYTYELIYECVWDNCNMYYYNTNVYKYRNIKISYQAIR